MTAVSCEGVMDSGVLQFMAKLFAWISWIKQFALTVPLSLPTWVYKWMLADCKGWIGTIYRSHVMLHVGVWASSAIINIITLRLMGACILE